MRNGFTFIELLLAGFILSTLSFGAIYGITRVSGFVDRRSELLAADGFCWDVAWTLFNDYRGLKYFMDGAQNEDSGLPAYPRPEGVTSFQIKGEVEPQGEGEKEFDFLSHLRYPDSPPVCTIILSNRYDSVTMEPDESGIYISVNLEWGPPNLRRMLVRTPETSEADVDGGRVIVFDHPVTLFCSKFERSR